MSRHRARYDSRLQQSSTFDARFPVTRTSQLIDATTRDVGALQRIDQFVMAIRKSSSMSAIKYSNSVSVNCWFVSMHEFRVNFVPTPEFVLQSDGVPSVWRLETPFPLFYLSWSVVCLVFLSWGSVSSGFVLLLSHNFFSEPKVVSGWKLKFIQRYWIYGL